MTFLRASTELNPHTSMMAADALRIRRGTFDGRGRIERIDESRVRISNPSTHVIVGLTKGALDAPGDHPTRLDARGWRTLVGRCRRACIRHSEVGLPTPDDEIAIAVAAGLLEMHADILRDDDTIAVQAPTPFAPLRYRMGSAGMPIGGPAIIPAEWTIPREAMIELACERNLDRITVALQPVSRVWKVHEVASIDPVTRMRALARLRSGR